MIVLNFIVSLLLQQAPAKPLVIVGLLDGKKLAIESPLFGGFIENTLDDAILFYRQKQFRGEMRMSTVQRIDFSYKRGQPFLLGITLKNGSRLDVEADRRQFLTIKGATEVGTVTISNPDPITPEVKLRTHAPNRKHDLTIQYLEFPL